MGGASFIIEWCKRKQFFPIYESVVPISSSQEWREMIVELSIGLP